MSVRGWFSKEIRGFRGAWTSVDQLSERDPRRGFISRNVRFGEDKVYSREGAASIAAASVAGSITSMHNWITSSQNLMLMLEASSKVRPYNIATAAFGSDLITGLTCRQMTVAEVGTRAVMAFATTAGAAAAQARITNGSTQTDKCFQPPLTFSASSAVDFGGGNCTAGTHKIGLIFQSRSGFAGKPSPAPGDTFTPLSVTLNAGNRAISVSITLTTPAEAGTGSAVFPIMTRADNPSKWYFIPSGTPGYGVTISPPASTVGHNIAFTISISDEDLALRGEVADDYFNRLAQVVAGTGPFSPSAVCAYGKRIVYIVDNKAYISDIDDAQSVTEDLHVRQCPGQKKIVTAFQSGEVLYFVGDKWTAAVRDNGDVPATWPVPEQVAEIGTTAIRGVQSKTSGKHTWIAATSGLWTFQGGTYDPFHPGSPKPVTYFWADQWKRINWEAPYSIEVWDDVENLVCYVAAPLDANTSASHVFVVDYSEGLTHDRVDISLDNYSFSTFGCLGLARETNGKTALWIGPSSSGTIARLDSTAHSDLSTNAINSVYETGFIRLPNEIESNMIRVGNAHLRVRGSGSLIQTWYGEDRVLSVTPATITLATSPGIEVFSKKDLHPVENFSMRFETNASGHWFELFGVRPYYRPSLYNR